mmetsp:Transcript_19178/g.44220  ORF Transcript_19178/g.44220 Transcript_19178/m.44220 type:complete len:161 (+) Transcript_19178:74-556(+)
MARLLAVLAVLGLCLGGVWGNVSEQNVGRSHTLHAQHRAAQGGKVSMLLRNPDDAPLVTGKSIDIAREMAMAEAADDAASAAAEKAAKEAEHQEIRHKIVKEITEPFKEYNPAMFLLVGFGTVFVVTILFYFAERYWLQNSLNLQSIWDEEINKRMYPMF